MRYIYISIIIHIYNDIMYNLSIKYLVWNVQESDCELDSAMNDSVIDETEMDIDMTQPAVQRGKGTGGGVEKEEVVEREAL